MAALVDLTEEDSFDYSNVVALVVSKNDESRAPLLPPGETLSSVRSQTRPPDAVVQVSVGSKTAQSEQPRDGVISVNAGEAKTLGAAVWVALRSVPEVADADWIWVLHDDLVAEPTALAELLAATTGSQNIAAVGPKQVRYGEPDHLLEVGIDATATARRIYRVEPDEIDQGQHDGREEVLAVGTAGMLLKRSAFEEIEGFDPALGPFGDGLELGRRFWRAGYRVIAVPKAVVQHAQASYGHESEGRGSYAARRTAQLYNWALTVPTWAWIPFMVWMPVLTVLRSLGRLFSRHPAQAFSEWQAYFGLVKRTSAILRGRARIRRVATVPQSALRPLETSPTDILRTRRSHRRIVVRGTDTQVALDAAARQALQRHRVRVAALFWSAFAVLSLVSILIWYPYVGGLQGGAWASLPSGWLDLMAQAWSGWQVSGDGLQGPASPLLLPLSLLAVPFAVIGLSPAQFAEGLVLLALPLAFWGGWGLSSSFTRVPAIRLAGGVAWSATAPLLYTLERGDLGALLLYLLLPVIITGLARSLRAPLSIRAKGVEDVYAVGDPSRIGWLGLAGLSAAAVAAVVPLSLVFMPFAALIIGRRRTSTSDQLERLPVEVEVPSARPTLLPWAAVLVTLPGLALVSPALILGIARGGWSSLSSLIQGPQLPVGGVLSLLGMPQLQVSPPGASLAEAAEAGLTSPWLLGLTAVSGLVLLAWSTAVAASSVLKSKKVSLGLVAWTSSVGFTVLTALQATVWPGGGSASVVFPAFGTVALIVSVSSAYGDFWIQSDAPVRRGGQRRPWMSSYALAGGVPAGLTVVFGLMSVISVLVLGPIGILVAGNDTASAKGEMQDEQGQSRREGNLDYVEAAPVPVIPMIAQEAQKSSRAARLLTIEIGEDGAVEAALLRGVGLQQADLVNTGGSNVATSSSAAATDSLRTTVATLVSVPNPAMAQSLSAHAVDLLLVSDDSLNMDEVRETLDATYGLEKIGSIEGAELWRVRPDGFAPSRVSVYQPLLAPITVASGTMNVRTQIEVEEAGTLVLAESADPAWTASFEGKKLSATEDPDSSQGWRQAFEIPAGSGLLTIRYAPAYLPWWWGFSAASLIVLLLLSVPRGLRSQRLTPVLREPGAEALVLEGEDRDE